jgi:hypothetical protein
LISCDLQFHTFVLEHVSRASSTTYPYSIVKEALIAKINGVQVRDVRTIDTRECLRIGGADRDRTDDPLLAKQMLSQLSYSPRAARAPN